MDPALPDTHPAFKWQVWTMEGGMGEGIKIVEAFLRTLESRDLDKLGELVTEDIIYSNPPSPAHLGRQAMTEFLSFNYKRMDGSSCTIHHWAENETGTVVMNERTEYMHFGDKKAGATFMGIFEIRDGKICAWRDYWDHASFAAQMAAIGQAAGPGINNSSS
ncbi:MAG: limonene-1,2-epoxide hydrolase [Hirschia sp.]|nr:limonene-1,2-epoxide hydrolase [Hirschia sp.]MBF18409.1 limonene-1,2-epoxide hydrolase [Hirschia sp.]